MGANIRVLYLHVLNERSVLLEEHIAANSQLANAPLVSASTIPSRFCRDIEAERTLTLNASHKCHAQTPMTPCHSQHNAMHLLGYPVP